MIMVGVEISMATAMKLLIGLLPTLRTCVAITASSESAVTSKASLVAQTEVTDDPNFVGFMVQGSACKQLLEAEKSYHSSQRTIRNPILCTTGYNFMSSGNYAFCMTVTLPIVIFPTSSQSGSILVILTPSTSYVWYVVGLNTKSPDAKVYSALASAFRSSCIRTSTDLIPRLL